jgi:hypothetical protein
MALPIKDIFARSLQHGFVPFIGLAMASCVFSGDMVPYHSLWPITKNNAVFVDQLHNNPAVFKLRLGTNT